MTLKLLSESLVESRSQVFSGIFAGPENISRSIILPSGRNRTLRPSILLSPTRSK